MKVISHVLVALLIASACGDGSVLSEFDPQDVRIFTYGTVRDATVSEVEEVTPFRILMPSYIPDGMIMTRLDVAVPGGFGSDAVVRMFFESEDRDQLGVTQGDGQVPDSAETRTPWVISGHQGVLLESNGALTVKWYIEKCDRSVGVGGAEAMRDTLIEVAESIGDDC